jgi:cytochrome c5
MRRLLPLLLLAAGCAGLPHPTPADLVRAKARYPDATQASLEEGRSAFVTDCSGCHALPLPKVHAPAEWPAVVRDMAERGDLSKRDRVLIEQFLVTLAAAPQTP